MSAPHTPYWASLQPDRVQAVHAFGFTERQARFLTHVLLFSGVFLERQYCQFSDTTHGQKSHDFIERLVAQGYATPVTPGCGADGCITSSTRRSTRRSGSPTTGTGSLRRWVG